jgi:hypothetical protein
MKIESPSRILTSDFADEDKEVAGKIGGILNNFNEEVYSLTNKNITIADNLDQLIKVISVRVNSSGEPTTTLSFKNTLKGKIQGTQVIRVFNGLPTSQPFITFTETNGVVTINHITGLNPNTDYQLVILVIGQ